jgi:hypothetical protein
MAPKCGTTTIAGMLNVHLHIEYSVSELDNLNNPEYKKIIIIRKNVIDRFLSGFYEDLFNNYCYDNLDVTFNDYLLFLYKCFKEKIKNVNNMNVYNNNLDAPVWFGNCSELTLNITDENGNFCSHIMSQKYALSYIINKINCKNVQIVELNNLSSLLNLREENEKNKKIKISNIQDDFIFSKIYLSEIKKKRIIIPSNYLNKKQQKKILEMYEEDTIFFNELEKKFNVFID